MMYNTDLLLNTNRGRRENTQIKYFLECILQHTVVCFLFSVDQPILKIWMAAYTKVCLMRAGVCLFRLLASFLQASLKRDHDDFINNENVEVQQSPKLTFSSLA